MAKENNQFKIDYAFPGLCSHCHAEVAEFNGTNNLGRPIITRMKPNYREFTVELDNQSLMDIPLCEKCYDTLGPEHMQAVMESEINGWQHEVDECLPAWSDNKKLEHMTQYSKRFITKRTDKPFKAADNSKIKKPRKSKLRVKVKEA